MARSREEVRSEEHVRQKLGIDRAKDVEQLLTTLVKETNKFETRFGKIRDEKKMLVVKTMMLERLSNSRLRGATLNYEELLVALENIIIDWDSPDGNGDGRKG